jgi:hypothetical protein
VSGILSSTQIQSAEGAGYESQGQARSEAERVAPGFDKRENEGLKGRNIT